MKTSATTCEAGSKRSSPASTESILAEDEGRQRPDHGTKPHGRQRCRRRVGQVPGRDGGRKDQGYPRREPDDQFSELGNPGCVKFRRGARTPASGASGAGGSNRGDE